jgi:hypothetical protein
MMILFFSYSYLWLRAISSCISNCSCFIRLCRIQNFNIIFDIGTLSCVITCVVSVSKSFYGLLRVLLSLHLLLLLLHK